MSLIACPECKAEVSTAATACPKCGFPLAKAAAAAPPAAVPTASPPVVVVKPAYVLRQPQWRLRPLGVLIGVVMVGLGLFAALKWVPEHDPTRINTVGKAANAVVWDKQFINKDAVGYFYFISWAAVVGGVIELLAGSVARDGIVGYCKTCDMSVNVKRLSFGRLRCERCGGKATK